MRDVDLGEAEEEPASGNADLGNFTASPTSVVAPITTPIATTAPTRGIAIVF